MTHFKIDHHAPSGYELQMRCEDENFRVQLYAVLLIHPTKGTNTYHVLAKDELMAVGMAKVAAQCAMYEVPKEVYDLVVTHVTQIPMIVQGWGKATM